MKKTIWSVSGSVVLMALMSPVFAKTVQIGALVAGQVEKVYVKTGQQVKSGQLLIKIDDTRYQAKLKALQASVEMTRLKLADAKIELDQALDLYDRTVSAKRELDAAQLAYDVAQQLHLKAQAELEMGQAWLKYYVIKAPVAGQIKTINAPKGATVYKENTPIIQIEVP